ncbi:MAG: toll/interleukin-1 receptor domain-containing protein, partial [Chloroflexota bacterium]|nr:toll/interleukin-1 receptor domain-containing protein [Chloroflexota bacterium]
MSDIFISYSRKNSAFARRLIASLTLVNKDTWVDWEGIPLTAPNWWSEIKAGIEGADSFAFIISPASMASVVCNMELNYALELGKRIIPVVYEDVVSRDAFASIADYKPEKAMLDRLAGKNPLEIAQDNWHRLRHINWMPFRETDDFEETFKRFI